MKKKKLGNGVIWSVAPESRIHSVVRLVVSKVRQERISFLPELVREVEPMTVLEMFAVLEGLSISLRC